MPGGDRTQEADQASRPLSAGRDAADSPPRKRTAHGVPRLASSGRSSDVAPGSQDAVKVSGGGRTQEADQASRPLSAGRDAADSPRAKDARRNSQLTSRLTPAARQVERRASRNCK